MKPPFSYVPLLPVLASLGAGILLYFLSDSTVLPILELTCATLLYFLRKEYYGTLLCVVAVGWSVTAVNTPVKVPEVFKQSGLTYTAITHEGYDTESGFEIECEVTGYINPIDSTEYRLKPKLVRLVVPAGNPVLFYGDSIRFRGELISTHSNPDLPDEFDPGKRSDFSVTRFRVKKTDLEIGGNKGGLKSWLAILRHRMAVSIIDSGTSENCTNFLLASLLGEGKWISKSQRELYSRTGMSHILALSGAHVGIIISMLSVALFPLLFIRLRKVRSIIIILLLWGYVIMTGGSPSVTRAVIMVTLLLIGEMLRRPYSGMNALCLAAILILLFSPEAILQPGFQLSFMAVASITILAEKINPLSKTFLHKPSQWIILPVAATMGTVGLVLYHFHFFPLYVILAAPVATILLTLVMFGGILLIPCSMTHVSHKILTEATDGIFGIANHYLGITDTLPWGSVENIYISVPTTLIITLFPFVLAAYVRYRNKSIIAIWIIVVTLSIGIENLLRPRYAENEIFITDHPYHLCIAAKSGKEMFVLTNADKVNSAFLLNEFVESHHNYLSKRGISNVKLLSDTSEHGNRRGLNVKINGKRFVILDDNGCLHNIPYPVDYLIVTNGFRGEILQATDSFTPKNIVLTRNLNHRLRTRYMKELMDAGYNPVDISRHGTLRINDLTNR